MVAFVFGAAILELLVNVAGVPEIGAQAISIVAATPLNFVGNKMWSFGPTRAGLLTRLAVRLALVLAVPAWPAAAPAGAAATPELKAPDSFTRAPGATG